MSLLDVDRSGPIAAAIALLAALSAAVAAPGPAAAQEEEMPEAVEYCMACHSDEGFTMELEDGSELDLSVDPETYLRSVHGGELVCTDCHQGYDDMDEHPSGATFASRRQYALTHYETCKQCHFDTYTRTVESIHFEYLEAGFEDMPVCTDCHGAHDVVDPHRKEAMMSRSCAECHAGVYETYAHSVHGEALVEQGNEDVPGCADCHTAHSIADPTTVAFRLRSPEICIECHGDERMMAEYDIPTDVATTYLTDFHGVTAALADPSEIEERQLVVTCIDCHGVHDIASPAVVGEAAMKSRVRESCASCHEDAGTDFPDAWLSHYRPSLRHHPLVWLVSLFYKIFIPFVIGGLALQVGLHLYRVASSR